MKSPFPRLTNLDLDQISKIEEYLEGKKNSLEWKSLFNRHYSPSEPVFPTDSLGDNEKHDLKDLGEILFGFEDKKPYDSSFASLLDIDQFGPEQFRVELMVPAYMVPSHYKYKYIRFRNLQDGDYGNDDPTSHKCNVSILNGVNLKILEVIGDWLIVQAPDSSLEVLHNNRNFHKGNGSAFLHTWRSRDIHSMSFLLLFWPRSPCAARPPRVAGRTPWSRSSRHCSNCSNVEGAARREAGR